jgi:hypothetical protein
MKKLLTLALLALPLAVLAEAWPDKAEPMLKKMLDEQGAQLAKTIVGITHPSGKEPEMEKTRILKVHDNLNVTLVVKWRGGLTKDAHETEVFWELSKERHIKAEVTQDTAPVKVDRPHAKKLDEYFRTELYPVLISNLHE